MPRHLPKYLGESTRKVVKPKVAVVGAMVAAKFAVVGAMGAEEFYHIIAHRWFHHIIR